jgi:hypothetical protein
MNRTVNLSREQKVPRYVSDFDCRELDFATTLPHLRALIKNFHVNLRTLYLTGMLESNVGSIFWKIGMQAC